MRKVFVGILSVMLAFSLAGCGAKQTAPEFNPQYYPACYDPIAKLCKDQDNSSEIKGAATGAAIGALGGALAGGLSSGSWKGAAVGAAAGAVAGGMTGFFTARLAKISDRNERLEAYLKDLDAASKNWDLEAASVEKAYKCYREQIALLKKNYQEKKISREDFSARMDEIKAGLENIDKYWADAQHRIDASIADSANFLEQADTKEAIAQAKDKKKYQNAHLQKVKKQQKNNDSAQKEQQMAWNALNELYDEAPKA